MLQGEKVRLRALERSDADALWRMFNDLEVETRVSAGKVRPTSLAKVEADLEHKDEPGGQSPTFVRFGIEAVIDGAAVLVGSLDLWGIDEHNAITNVGLAIRRESWSQGYGADALRTVVAYAFNHLNLRKVSLQVLADDERAVQAYRNAGFVEEGRLKAHNWYDGAYRDVLWMAILRD